MTERKHLVIHASDPPWMFNDELPGSGRGASKHYESMTVREIETMKLPQSFVDASHAVLFLWMVETMQLEALRVCLAWRCMPYGSIVWNKYRQNGALHTGMGHITRGSHERCIIAVRGDYTGGYEPAVHDERSSFDAPMPVDENNKLVHSAKPDAFYSKVERLYPHADMWIETFARRTRTRWNQFGDELGKLDQAARP